MSRAIEDYICASEDRSHYNNETWFLNGFYYLLEPRTNIYQITNKIKASGEVVDTYIPEADGFVIDENVVGAIPDLPDPEE